MGRGFIALSATLLYWLWESQADGNIRVDLLVIYPLLTLLYLALLWKPYRWWSIGITLALMGINFGFFLVSYDLFDKHPG